MHHNKGVEVEQSDDGKSIWQARANVEIRDAVGEDNFFLFGMTVQQVEETRAAGYRPRDSTKETRICAAPST